MSTAPKHRHLPDKEAKLFKELLTQYELRQYKKGLKAADTILKKFPNHGETLALKALTIHSSLPTPTTVSSKPKEEEAEAMARLAIKKDITSHITWHVLGILAKSRKDWDEASRAFAMARKQDNDNLPLMRDCISLYLHTRQYDQAVAARHHYLTLRPNIRSHWLSLMIAHQLNGNIDEAIEVYEGLQLCSQTEGGSANEKSQLALHVIKMLMVAKRWSAALDSLNSFLYGKKILSPRGEASQLKAEILVAMGSTQEAEDAYRALLEQNPDNLEYYRGFLRTKGLDIDGELNDEDRGKILHQLELLADAFPRSTPPKRLALGVATGEAFREAVRRYLVNGLERGVPSLFVDVKGLYRDAERMRITGEVVEEIIEELQKGSSLHSDDSIAPPTALLWGYYFLALHLSHPLHPSPSPKRSLELLEIALKHTPTLPEVYMAKATVLKRAGDPMGAAEAMEEARLLDGQDRFLNSKAAKYWLRAGNVSKAEELLVMFTKKDVVLVQDLTDLQCLWFHLEEAYAHRRNNNYALALKRFNTLVKIFQEYDDDQYDFHTYSMRRNTFGAYLELIHYEDQIRTHPAYIGGALGAIDIYCRVFDDPSITEEKLTAEEEAERKRAAKKAQKADAKARRAAAAAGGSETKKEDQPIPDADPLGQELIKTETPMEEAYKVWKPLEQLCKERVETWVAGYEIQIRRKLYLAALHCLLEAHALDADCPDLHRQILHFRRTVATAKDLPSTVSATIGQTLPDILPTATSSSAFNADFLSRHSTSPMHILGAAEGLLEIHLAESSRPSNSVADITAILDRLVGEGVPPNVPALLRAMELLERAGASPEQVDAWEKKCRERCPLAWVFASKEEKGARVLEVNGEVMVNGDGGKADV